MGEVYEAQDQVLRTQVALKTILPAFAADPALLERFRREVLLARRISHPNVCRIYELYSTLTSTGEPLHFLTMEFLEGESLTQRLHRRGSMGSGELLPILRQVSAALDAAHAEGVVHRDFKTSNVMIVTREGGDTRSGELRAVVTDFGIARSLWAEPGAAEKVTGVGLLGTPEYMAPEQVTGGEVGPAADIYALGVVLYEALTGKTPFGGATPLECAVRRVRERPTAPRELLPRLDGEWNRAILRCLEQDPARRFSSAGELVRFLEHPRTGSRRRLLLTAGIIGLVALVLAWGAWHRGLFRARHDERWLRAEVIPELHRLADSDQLLAAQLLAMKADAELPGDPMLANLWRSFAETITIRSEPAGARVSFQDYQGTDPVWHPLGITPVTLLFPRGVFRVRFELKGHRTSEIAASTHTTFRSTIPLDRLEAHGDDLLHVPGGRFGPGEEPNSLELQDFQIDKYEVTNLRYKAFVDAGGYRRREFWRYPFVKDGREVTWQKALATFKDRTGRPGPSSWELSTYPQGQDSYPVGGLSWYEAAAFAAFEGRDLPTVYHWRKAAGLFAAGWIIPMSNFSGKGPAPVGQYRGLSVWGALDMAGNVREWCFNEGARGLAGRMIAGGGWDDPSYTFEDRFVQSPWDRSPTNGVRLVTFLRPDPNLDRAREPVVTTVRDYSKEKPVGETEFRIYRRMYDYDPKPLHEVVEAKVQGTDWVRERIAFDAAYPGARVTAYLFLPRNSRPPYQTIVYFPGSAAIELKSFDEDFTFWDFIVRSGRAFMFPVYRGTFERQKELNANPPEGTVADREVTIQLTQDLRRSIDYLETRQDIDKKLGYFGFSWGGYMGGIIPAVEPRLKVSVLLVAGLSSGRPLPEADAFNFIPRVKIPTLMLNGRYDASFPFESAQVPMFRTLGTPVGLKRQIVYETGHFVPRDQLIKETIDWYDQYLGPVNSSRGR
jgi:formylglycine-generating enzyme required for sulfatase activity/dienelactone hydrolase